MRVIAATLAHLLVILYTHKCTDLYIKHLNAQTFEKICVKRDLNQAKASP
jgi:hypothetical protein